MYNILFEPFLQERIEFVKARAANILDGREATEEGLTLQYRFELAQRYHMGIFSDYFENLTLDELALEVFLWRELDDRNNPEKQKQIALEKYKKEVDTQVAAGGTY